ncbi:MAG: hypothetical protein E7773_06400 [Sphingomonas sp.]|uniref:hypothetical protein n=1 Tax=Sphingomonas sp. TaxID=28214 RepID=UPI0012198FD2|nr:hypothetical protein [Sphingomonas sp.]THD36634.1 MAG: hypothetical protein E7773_06400 [Sphingomonas sp.]
MSFLDSILGQVGSNVDIKNLAEKVGISPEQAESAVAALAKAHPQPGDTVDAAAASTGLDSGILSQIVGHIGGEGALGQFASMLGGAGGNEGGGIMDKIGGLAGGLFGGEKN